MTSTSTDTLFRPFQVKGLKLKNRIVMAPMTRGQAPEGVPGAPNAAYYRRRAEGGVGLILSEGTVVERPASKNEPGIPSFYGEQALAGWKTVINEVHAVGGKMAPQLWHVGSVPSHVSPWVPDAPVESPSGLFAPGNALGGAMTEEDIADTVAAFGRAAADAKRLGFDMLEVHGAHGYLIDQFFWAGTNERTDGYYGATLKERARFAVELISAIRAAVGEDFAISLRVSQWKQQDYSIRLAPTPDEIAEWLGPLAAAGVDLFHCSQRRFWTPEFPDLDGEQGLTFAGWVKKLTGTPTICVGSVGLSGDAVAAFSGESSTPERLDDLVHRLDRDEFDLIAVGRALLSDPNWVRKVRGEDDEPFRGYSPSILSEALF